jgi:hypothetical protein
MLQIIFAVELTEDKFHDSLVAFFKTVYRMGRMQSKDLVQGEFFIVLILVQIK